MCSNFEPIHSNHAGWVKQQFGCELPQLEWRQEAYPEYLAPFIFMHEGKPRCELAQFGLLPPWAIKLKHFGKNTYNARSETVQEKRSFSPAWKQRRFGLILMESFFEPNWETGKSVRWRIKRADGEPSAAASIWERVVDKSTGEIITSFSMLTINADGHEVMKHFHRPADEKRSIVVLNNPDYSTWLNADHQQAINLLKLAPAGFLSSEPAPRK